MDLRDALNELNKIMVENQYDGKSKLPRFYVSHISKIIDTISNSNPNDQNDENEKKALKRLQKIVTNSKSITGLKQIEIYKGVSNNNIIY